MQTRIDVSSVEKGAWLGAGAGLLASVIYGIGVGLWLTLDLVIGDGIPPAAGEGSVYLAIVVPAVIAVLALAFGVLPAMVIGALGGALIGIIASFAGQPLSQRTGALIGVLVGLAITLLLNGLASTWAPTGLLADMLKVAWLELRLPSVLIVVSAVAVGWRLSKLTLSTE